ncbi:MAG: FHA domain-containing protein [Clostridiaceae bacterium]|nr:FHA domain-containing protein [Clostridiaceae bacterium]
MNSLFLEDSIKENRDNSNISYILEREQLFFETGYKVLQNQEKNGFAKCVKILHNGKIKLVYDISKYKSLQSLLDQLTPESFFSIINRLFNIVSEAKHNGFIQCENIDVDLSKIFIDSNNLNVFLIYLPVNTSTNLSRIGVFERELKKNLAEAITKNSNLYSDKVSRLFNDLQNDNYLLEDIKENIKKSAITRDSMHLGQTNEIVKPEGNLPTLVISAHTQTVQPKVPSNKKDLMKWLILFVIQVVSVIICAGIMLFLGNEATIYITLIVVMVVIDLTVSIFVGIFAFREKKSVSVQVQNNINFKPIFEGGATEVLEEIFIPSIALSGVGTPANIEVVISKKEFVIGKNPESVDGVIPFNKAISRVHCKISFVNNLYMLKDLKSANGTYVNSVKLQEDQQIEIIIGDKIRLANSEFIVRAVR